MHYYQFNIGDYQSHTAHLSESEDLAYRRMLDWCYLHEKPLPLEAPEIARQIRMRTHSDCIAVVLREFFERTADGWISLRVVAELHKVGEKSEKASASAKARWVKKPNEIKDIPEDANAMRTHSEGNATQDPIHMTHNPIPKKNTVAPPDGVTESVWGDFVILRKSKKMPITETALKGLMREAGKANISLDAALRTCCERGWGGFKAEWLTQPHQAQRTAQGTNLAAARAIFGDERQLTAKPDFILEEGYCNDRTPKIA